MTLEIRSMQRDDHRIVVGILHKALSAFLPADADMAQIWERFCAQQNVLARVAVSEGHVVGYGSVVLETKIRGGMLGHIEDIVVLPEFQGLGVGKAIVQDLVSRCRDQGCYKVALACSTENMPFYEGLGFSRDGTSMSLLIGR